MKKPSFAFSFALLISATLMFTGCVPGQTDEEELPLATTEEAEADGDYLGSWLRTATYVDGILQGQTPADLTFNANGTYSSYTDVCATSGTYEEAEDGTVTMVMLESGCPGNIPLPFTVTYTYMIEENEDEEEMMTMYTANIMETYVRN